MRRSASSKVIILSLIVGLFSFSIATTPLQALSGSQFKAGKIMSDPVFYNGNSMSAAQIQSFLNAKVPACDTNGTQPYGGTTRKAYAASRGVSTPFICLKSFSQNTPSKAGESGLCSALSARSNRTAAQIIDDVSRACGVSQKALIVLLQKEQSLITDDWPWPIQYRSATGYGCPDTAPCDSEYYGFFNQVYNAARQFKRYRANPNLFNHRPNQTNFVRFNPNSACGGSNVYIENQATAGLYNYTPYQPNSAALNNLYGEGNGCSAYGNRNFWRMFNDWFGSTITNPPPDAYLVGDWDGDGNTTTGIKRGSTYMLDDTNNGSPDIIFSYGRTTDAHIVGDWDGDGKDEIGLRRGATYFLDSNNNGSPDIIFSYGRTTDAHIVGDWDGDGKDEIGLRRGATYFLDSNNNGSPDIIFSYGRTTDAHIVGDWDGDGKDEIGLRRGATYFLDSNNNGSPDIIFSYGRTTDAHIVGDWDGDGKDEIGLRRGATYFLDSNNNGSPDIIFSYGRTTDAHIVGDWDGDGKDEIGLRRGATYFYTYHNNGSTHLTFILGY